MEAASRLVDWADTVLNRALVELNEKQRWDAIVSASVVRQGDNGYTETVAYPNPVGHRVAAGGAWSNNAYDPFADIIAMAEFAAGKGYTINRIIAPRPVVSKLSQNDNVKSRVGVSVVNSAGQITGASGRASIQAINAVMERDGLPVIETYDLQYRTQNGTGFFLPRNVFVMVATTGRDESIDLGDDERFLDNTIGYTAIGRAAGQATPGRVIQAMHKTDKPPRIEGEAWQTSLPVITDPEAVFCISAIS